jgi:antitoxin ParD1/3/4
MQTVELGVLLDGFVEEQIASGRYRDASEVIRAALRLLEQEARRAEQFRAEFDAVFGDPRPVAPGQRGVRAA